MRRRVSLHFWKKGNPFGHDGALGIVVIVGSEKTSHHYRETVIATNTGLMPIRLTIAIIATKILTWATKVCGPSAPSVQTQQYRYMKRPKNPSFLIVPEIAKHDTNPLACRALWPTISTANLVDV